MHVSVRRQRGMIAASQAAAADAPPQAPADYENWSWGDLRSHASDRGVLRAGMTRAQVVAALRAA